MGETGVFGVVGVDGVVGVVGSGVLAAAPAGGCLGGGVMMGVVGFFLRLMVPCVYVALVSSFMNTLLSWISWAGAGTQQTPVISRLFGKPVHGGQRSY